MEDLIRQLQACDHAALDQLLTDFGVVLDQHIRSEERVLFVLYEEQIPSDMKHQLGERLQHRLGVLKAVHH